LARASAIDRIQADLRSGDRSAAQVTEDFLKQVQAREPEVHGFISLQADAARAQAAELDERAAKEGWDALGPLAGVPLAFKDNICTKGLQTTAGSRVLEGYLPPYDATVVAKLTGAGAVVLGKTNMDEFGMGSTTETSAYQVTRNPADLSRVPGGSSGGSAAAVASGMCVGALGSDTGGSVRGPASFCGVVGLKPTYGRVSRYGLIAYASSLDCIGPIATSVKDAALMLNAMAGFDANDATSAHTVVDDYAAGLVGLDDMKGRPLSGRRVAVVKETLGEGVDEEVQAAVRGAMQHFKALGAEISEVSLETFALGLPAYYVIATSEASSNLSRYDGVRYGQRDMQAAGLKEMYDATRKAGLGAEVKRRILMGTYSLSAGYYDAYYKRAQQVRTLVKKEMDSALADFDVLITPCNPTPAYKIGEKTKDPLAMYKGDLMTVNLNLSGLPAIAVPCGAVQDGEHSLPIGLQMIGRAFGEKELLEIANIYELTRF